jgi:UPF0716 protein FxsA
LFIVIGRAIGVVPTLLGVLVTAIVGATLLRMQGLSLLAEIRDSVNGGRLPARSIAEAMMVGLGGLLLLLPGYFSDLIGILLLIPPVRGLLYGFLARRVKVVGLRAASSQTERPAGPKTIELDGEDWRSH